MAGNDFEPPVIRHTWTRRRDWQVVRACRFEPREPVNTLMRVGRWIDRHHAGATLEVVHDGGAATTCLCVRSGGVLLARAWTGQWIWLHEDCEASSAESSIVAGALAEADFLARHRPGAHHRLNALAEFACAFAADPVRDLERMHELAEIHGVTLPSAR
ncbi:MAG: hypothetical protein OXF68_16750 [Gammaproteobacteria bacterium]|nr:hypothetical protein [Gammaproteobacteria bacterium]